MDNGRAVYPELAGLIRQDIADGTLPIDADLLQSEIIDRYPVSGRKVSVRTVQRAMGILEAEGLVENRGKSPYKVISRQARQTTEQRLATLEQRVADQDVHIEFLYSQAGQKYPGRQHLRSAEAGGT
jgi:DNA-binding GntR family transcriptional regulator